eukprot:4346862-Alexandrium_andersonii.AAC.1
MQGVGDGGARARRERRCRAWARQCAAAWRGSWALGDAAGRLRGGRPRSATRKSPSFAPPNSA